MRARDVMTRAGDTLTPDTTLREASLLLEAARDAGGGCHPRCLPVLDGQGALVGLLSVRDILKAVYPFYMTLSDVADLAWDGMLEHIAHKLARKKVGEVMVKDLLAVHEDAPLMECLDHMMRRDEESLPVVGPDGRLKGMAHEADVLRAITRSMEDGATLGGKS